MGFRTRWKGRAGGTAAVTTASALAVTLASALITAAVAQNLGERAYREHCGGCHGSDAASFARQSMRWDAAAPVTAKAGKSLGELLARHGAADANERAAIVDLLVSKLPPASK